MKVTKSCFLQLSITYLSSLKLQHSLWSLLLLWYHAPRATVKCPLHPFVTVDVTTKSITNNHVLELHLGLCLSLLFTVVPSFNIDFFAWFSNRSRRSTRILIWRALFRTYPGRFRIWPAWLLVLLSGGPTWVQI